MVVVLFLVAVVVINLAFVVLPAREVHHLLTNPAGRLPRGQVKGAEARRPLPQQGDVTVRPVPKPITLRSMSSIPVTTHEAA